MRKKERKVQNITTNDKILIVFLSYNEEANRSGWESYDPDRKYILLLFLSLPFCIAERGASFTGWLKGEIQDKDGQCDMVKDH